MKKVLLLLVILLLGSPTFAAEPASLSFDPVQMKVNAGDIFKVDVNIYTGSQPVGSTDIWISYPSELLEAQPDKITNGNIFQTVDAKTITAGKLYIFGVEERKENVQPAQGKVATIYFKAINTGVTQLSFDCNQSTNSSQIIKATDSLTNIISCPSTISHITTVSIDSNAGILGAHSQKTSINIIYVLILVVVGMLTVYLFSKYKKSTHL